MQTIRIQGSGFTRLISRQSGAGSILVTNTSLTVTVFLTDKDVGNPATADSVTLGPNASKTFDGSSDVYGFVTGGFADVEVIEGGVATFLGLTQSSGALVLPSIRSPNFITTVSGWSINNDGTAEFNSITIRGSTIVGSVSLWYDGPNPATANLVASVASSAGNDGFGHAYKAGATVYGTDGTYVEMVAGTPASLFIGSGDSAESTAARMITQVSGAGVTRKLSTTVRAPRVTGENANAAFSLSLTSPSADLSQRGQVSLIASDDGVNFSQVNVGQTGIVATSPTSVQLVSSTASVTVTPTAVTIGVVPVFDFNGDQLTAPQTNLNIFNLTNPTAATDITIAYTIPANDGKAGSTYMIEVPFTGVWQASGNLNFEYDLNGTITNLVPVAAGLAVAGHNYGGCFRLYLKVRATGAGGTCDIWGSGDITDTSVARTGATSSSMFGMTTGHAFDTTVANTLAVAVVFSASNAGQTILARSSSFYRGGQ